MNQNDALIEQLKRQNRLLKSGLGLAAGAFAVLLLTGATGTDGRARFTEIDVERINIMGPNGKPDLVIANRERLPAPIINGKQSTSRRGKVPGMIFYNAVGDENGGFVFDGKLDDKGKPAAGMHLSMDRFGGDQQVSLGHYEGGGTLESGLKIYDRGLHAEYSPLREAYDKAAPGPEKDALLQKWKEAGGQQTSRMFVGKTRGKSSAVILAAADGQPRIMMVVTPEGEASLDFYDKTGKVVQHFPQADAAAVPVAIAK
jgi:hypothetical protein